MIQYRFSQAPDRDAPHIAHYYGDQIRQLFMSVAALMLITSPFYADSLRLELPLILIGSLALVAIAALANPHNKNIFYVAAAMSGAGVVIYGMWALGNYEDGTFVQFIIRLAIAIAFLVAFYFNMKTLRAFVLGKVGKREEIGEFDVPRTRVERPSREKAWHEEFMPWFLSGGKSNGGRDNDADPASEDTGPRQTPGRRPEEIKPPYHPYEDPM